MTTKYTVPLTATTDPGILLHFIPELKNFRSWFTYDIIEILCYKGNYLLNIIIKIYDVEIYYPHINTGK